VIYLIGSLRNPAVGDVAKALRDKGYVVFDNWRAAGETADDAWRDYEQARNHSYKMALDGPSAKAIFEFDKRNLDHSDMAVLVMPAGRSCHLEMGYMLGRKLPGFVLLDKDPERFDVMYRFCTSVCYSVAELSEEIECLAYTIGHKVSYDNALANEIAPHYVKKLGVRNDYEGGWCWRTYHEAMEYKAANAKVDLGPDGKLDMSECDVYRLRLPSPWETSTIAVPDQPFRRLCRDARLFAL
jgi:hypothetical protein